MKIIKATLNHAEEILKLQKEAYYGQGEIYQNFNIRPLVQTLDSLIAEFSEKIFLIVFHEDQIIGTVRYWEEDKIVHVERLAIKPEFQNQGIGTLLMKELEKYSADAKEFRLFTGNKSLRNIHLYKKLGYSVYEEKDDGQGIVTLYMQKTVNE